MKYPSNPSLYHSLVLTHQQWESHQLQEQTNSTFVILLTHAFSSSPKQRPCPAWVLWGKQEDVPPAPMHMYTLLWAVMHKRLLENTN